ncbi:RICIN domain-containing protein [Streptomyces antimicrobicus]|uniref:RICIN domain-containing protein n=1 Tax=Streptomyces antimicrobicus TaxID=2883108 RepID=A0ABS8B3N3_9ACTN|nr:RICIN domain-containing protein [Streptomyces antimicrobicus]MCB5179228.1 RICIN domain-containing protein [Streptomyces antimicrobicus]
MKRRTRLVSTAAVLAFGGAVALAGAPTAAAAPGAGSPGASATSLAAPDKCEQRNTYRNAKTGYYLDVQGGGGKGAKIITWHRNGGANQLWCMERAKEGGWYFHPSYNLGLCMDSPEGGWKNPVLWNCKGNANQRFTVRDGLFESRASGRYVTGEWRAGAQVFMSTRPADSGTLAYWR